MDEAVLVHADVDESAERGDVSHDPRAAHLGLEILELVNVVAEAERNELVAGIAAGLGKLVEHVSESEIAELALELRGAFERLGAVAQEVAHGLPELPGERLEHSVALGMNTGIVERVLGLAQP